MIPYPLSRPFALLVLLLLAGPLPAADYAGSVPSISAGDTLALLVPDGASYRQVKVRLGEIDTPESRQPYGERQADPLRSGIRQAGAGGGAGYRPLRAHLGAGLCRWN